MTKDLNFRFSQLRNLKSTIIKNEDKIYDALKEDLGKCSFEAYTTEVGLVINEIDFMLRNLRKLAKPRKVKTPLLFIGGSSFIIPEPYGIVLIIGPWNYPFQLVMKPLVGAIAAGNCAILKPSEYSPKVSKIISEIINETFDNKYITVVEGGIEKTQTLLAQKFDYIFFTGGTSTGKAVMEAAAKNLIPVTLELGGKSPCIIDESVNIKHAAQRITWGKFLNAGQTCVAPDYILVNKKVKTELIQSIIATIKEFFGKEPSFCGHYCKIVNDKHFNRIVSLMNEGVILFGGQNDRESLYISPTIIDSIRSESLIMQEEIFGPLLPILEYEDLNEAIDFINCRPKPLALYFFSSNKRNVKRVLTETTSGGVCINDTINHMVTPYLPFGGIGESGMGTYHGRASFEIFTHKKSVLNNQIAFDIKIKYPPYNISLGMIKRIMKLFLS